MKRTLTSLLAASALIASSAVLAEEMGSQQTDRTLVPPVEQGQNQDLQVDRSFGNWGPWDSNSGSSRSMSPGVGSSQSDSVETTP
ncbi:hypothetical protein N8I74_16295 [Chitiniphilus purpureus]|uniref:Uncharacterized protein n=1 Tax=Chitiniphilus purpureus TaxID=2981137 RepID=A0ABY6DKJ1_9NEIS|nr:hypothetical protein [Chitiniphilus sp. CD1]UXY14859.1 hypothetical protein N8I74_16295 [Chitiniphilus sp. CD1]